MWFRSKHFSYHCFSNLANYGRPVHTAQYIYRLAAPPPFHISHYCTVFSTHTSQTSPYPPHQTEYKRRKEVRLYAAPSPLMEMPIQLLTPLIQCNEMHYYLFPLLAKPQYKQAIARQGIRNGHTINRKTEPTESTWMADNAALLKRLVSDEAALSNAVAALGSEDKQILLRQLFPCRVQGPSSPINSMATVRLPTESKDSGGKEGSNTIPTAEDADAQTTSEAAMTPADIIFNALDLNKDGHVSKPEFCTWYHRHTTHGGRLPGMPPNLDLSERVLPDDGATKAEPRSPHNATPIGIQTSATVFQHPLSDLSADVVQPSKNAEYTPLNFYQVSLVLFKSSIPYIGFGFMDNCLMLICGEVIDHYTGAVIGLSTMAAAGLGNTVSCAIGVVTGGFVERMVYRLGLPAAALTDAQLDSHFVKNLHITGSVIGICAGCLLGMFPLLLMDSKGKMSPSPTVTADASETEALSKPIPSL